MNSIDQLIDDAVEAINSPGEDTSELIRMTLLIMYAKGIGAAMRSMGVWPDKDAKTLQDVFADALKETVSEGHKDV